MLYRFRFTRCMKQAIGFTILLSGLLTAHGAAADSAAPDKCAEIKHLGTPDVQLLSGAHWVCHAGYLAAVPERLGYALWLAYRLTADQVAKCMPQKGTFRVDDALPAEYRAVPEDYKGTDFEPLQMAPAADFTSDPAAVADSYLMTNTLPKYAGWVTLSGSSWKRRFDPGRKAGAR